MEVALTPKCGISHWALASTAPCEAPEGDSLRGHRLHAESDEWQTHAGGDFYVRGLPSPQQPGHDDSRAMEAQAAGPE